MRLNKSLCADTRFGCCPDGTTPKTSVDDTCGKKLIGGCEGTQFGCCLDGKTAKKSHDDKC